MKNISMYMKVLVLAVPALLLSACGGGGGGGIVGGGGGLSLSITDAPVKDADIAEVWVRFTQVIIHPADGSGDLIVDVQDDSDPNNIKPYRDIELKSLVGGKTMLLGNIPLDAGDYSWIRLVIDPANTYIVETSGGSYLVDCPSCTQSGFKLNRSFNIGATGWIDFTIDFDLRKSITLSQPNKPRDDFHYKLRPTLRILDTALASSSISGEVTDARSEMSNPATPEGCWVYVYPGDAATIVPDDICLNTDTSICPLVDRPLLETPVMYDSVNNDGTYDYNTGFIHPGTYTIALLCEADDPDVDDNVLFIDETEVFADAVPGGAIQDLVLGDVTSLSFAKSLDATADADNSGSVTAGDTLTYRFLAANAGNVTLTGVTVTDPLPGLGALGCDQAQPATLVPGASLDCTADYVVQPADEGADLVNTATADADQTAPVTGSVSVPVAISP